MNMRLNTFIAAFFLVFLTGCAMLGLGTKKSGTELAKIGDEILTLEEFEEMYAKNNGGWEKAGASSMEDRERFLELLVKFKLKVREAHAQGILQDSSVQSELATYKVSVATSYMLEKELVEPHIKEMYNRKQEEIRASHILIRLNQNPTPADTVEAYNKAMKVIGLIPKISFDTLAVTYSEDQSASFNRGDLGFASLGKFVPEFEDACYGLNAGEYTKTPIRTQFGYHIIKVTARQPYKGAVRISHILRRFSPDLSDTLAIRDTMWMAYTQIKDTVDFAEAVRLYSDDPSSNHSGGDLGYYERNVLPPDIGEIFYSTPVDSITEPVRQSYGYHIFKITGTRGIGAYQELEKDLRQQYQNVRYPADYQFYLKRLKQKFGLNLNSTTLKQVAEAFDSTKTPNDSAWSVSVAPELMSQTLFAYGGGMFSVQDFVNHVNVSEEFRTTLLTASNIEKTVDRIIETKIIEREAKGVPDRHPGFTQLMNEYRDGIMLYRIEQDEVWKKLVVNDSLLRIYYDQTKEKYRWTERVQFGEILLRSDSVAQLAYKEILGGISFDSVAVKYTTRPGFKEKRGLWDFVANDFNFLSRYAAKLPVDTLIAPFQNPDGWSILQVIAKDSARVKIFEEALPEVTSGYQEYASKQREQEWVEFLKKKYPVVIKKEVLSAAFTKN